MILSDPNDFRDKNHAFSGPASNCLKRVIEAVQKVKNHCSSAITSSKSIFSWHFCDFCKVPIEDFPKNQNSDHDFDDQKDVIAEKGVEFS